MIPDIALMLTAYICFRCFTELMQMAPGGRNENLHPVASVLVALVAVAAIGIVVVCMMDVQLRGGEVGEMTRSLLEP